MAETHYHPQTQQAFTVCSLGEVLVCQGDCSRPATYSCYFADCGSLIVRGPGVFEHAPIAERPGVFQWNLLVSTGVNWPLMLSRANWPRCPNCSERSAANVRKIVRLVGIGMRPFAAALSAVLAEVQARDDALDYAESADMAAQYWYNKVNQADAAAQHWCQQAEQANATAEHWRARAAARRANAAPRRADAASKLRPDSAPFVPSSVQPGGSPAPA